MVFFMFIFLLNVHLYIIIFETAKRVPCYRFFHFFRFFNICALLCLCSLSINVTVKVSNTSFTFFQVLLFFCTFFSVLLFFNRHTICWCNTTYSSLGRYDFGRLCNNLKVYEILNLTIHK